MGAIGQGSVRTKEQQAAYDARIARERAARTPEENARLDSDIAASQKEKADLKVRSDKRAEHRADIRKAMQLPTLNDLGRDIAASWQGTAAGKSLIKAQKDVTGWVGDAFNNAKNAGLGNANFQAPTIGGVGGPGFSVPTGPVTVQDARGTLVNDPNTFRQYQTSLAQQLSNQAAGRGPSIAQMQLQQGQQNAQAAYFSQLASSRNNPLAARSAAMQSQQSMSQLNRDSAIQRLAEQQKAQETLGNVSNQARSGDLQSSLQAQNFNIENARLGAQFQELQAKYVGMGLDRDRANQLAAIEAEKINRGILQDNNKLQGDKLSAAAGAIKGVGQIADGWFGNTGAIEKTVDTAATGMDNANNKSTTPDNTTGLGLVSQNPYALRGAPKPRTVRKY